MMQFKHMNEGKDNHQFINDYTGSLRQDALAKVQPHISTRVRHSSIFECRGMDVCKKQNEIYFTTIIGQKSSFSEAELWFARSYRAIVREIQKPG